MEKITQKDFLKKVEKKYGFRLSPRQVNLYISLGLLPKPLRRKDESIQKAENIFDYNHLIFMMEINKRYQKFGFSSISGMYSIIGSRLFTLYEEIMLLKEYIKKDKLDHRSELQAYKSSFVLNGKYFKGISHHTVRIPLNKEPWEDEIEDYPFFPNYNLWNIYINREKMEKKYGLDIGLLSDKIYFNLKVPLMDISDPEEYLNKNLNILYFELKNKGNILY